MDQKAGPPPPATYNQGNAYNTQYGVPPGPPPAYAQTSSVVISQQPAFIMQHFNECPVRTTCTSCRAEVLTATHYETGTLVWVICLVLAFVGLWLFCCLIPFCLNGCKDVVHICPNCRATIGRYNRM